ncbi:N-6 DNA methylase, partial [bacterium]|nr:N-6 DNA methylase [bacterium]
AQVKYADLWGLRDGKYRYLLENETSTTDWQTLAPVPPYFFFVPKDLDLLSEYERGWNIPEIFPLHSTGFTTHRDRFVMDFDDAVLKERIARFRDPTRSDDEVRGRAEDRAVRGGRAGSRAG